MNSCYGKSLIVAISLVILVSSCALFEPHTIDNTDRILITAGFMGEWQLYSIKPNGRGKIQITSGDNEYFKGLWSPEKDKIVCNTSEDYVMGQHKVKIMNADGTKMGDLCWGSVYDWSATGDKLYYFSWPSIEVGYDNRGLWSIDTSGNNKIELSHDCYGAFSISPDGDKVVQRLINETDTTLAIYNFPSFSNPVLLNQDGGLPEFSNDGEEIVFGHDDPRSEGYGTIYIMNADGSDVRKLVEESTEVQYAFPRWSPDDERIIFISYDYNMENWYLWMIDRDGSNMHKVLSDNTIRYCDW